MGTTIAGIVLGIGFAITISFVVAMAMRMAGVDWMIIKSKRGLLIIYGATAVIVAIMGAIHITILIAQMRGL